jgi:uncharacterized membrane protein
MPDIVPNWHPAAVHFPIALGMTTVLLLVAARLNPARAGFSAAARLLLPLAAISAVIAAALGWHAFGTVEHDAAGHAVMTRHRDWALGATVFLALLALWDGWRWRVGQAVHGALLPAMLLLAGALAVTGWLGGEMVYRHGVGVMAPAVAAEALPAEAPPLAVPAPDTGPVVEHVHKDGKRHRH